MENAEWLHIQEKKMWTCTIWHIEMRISHTNLFYQFQGLYHLITCTISQASHLAMIFSPYLPVCYKLGQSQVCGNICTTISSCHGIQWSNLMAWRMQLTWGVYVSTWDNSAYCALRYICTKSWSYLNPFASPLNEEHTSLYIHVPERMNLFSVLETGAPHWFK